jgi:hypothetical protein
MRAGPVQNLDIAENPDKLKPASPAGGRQHHLPAVPL